MRFASLGSGSRGNATLVALENEYLLIDLGFSLRETEARLRRLGVAPERLGALLVTHEHGDHIRGVAPFARKYRLPVYMTSGTWLASALDRQAVPNLREINCHRRFTVGPFTVQPVAVPHDAREPCQFLVETQGLRLGVLSDLGHVSAHVRQSYADCDGLMVEFNHDLDLLEAGPYPPSLKQRVGGALGHLNNRQAAELLDSCDQARLQQLVLCHISQQNNRPELALREARRHLHDFAGQLTHAGQDEGVGWLQLN